MVNGDVEIKNYENKNIKEYLKIRHKQKRLDVICDCGAFSYINEKEPPALYTPAYISRIYNKLEFDYGVSVDHLIAKNLSKYLKEKRRLLSLNNAIKFFSHWQRKKDEYTFKPIGSAQGDTVNQYEDSVKTLINVGYKYIGLGTLIPRSDEFILEILERIHPLIKKSKTKLHLFGILRKECIAQFIKYGVTSFDSASYLRKAWLRSDNNYLGNDLNWYSAIRVPIVNEFDYLFLIFFSLQK